MHTSEIGTNGTARHPPAWPFLARPLLGLCQGIILYQLIGPSIPYRSHYTSSYVNTIGMLCAALIPSAICLAIPVLKPLRALVWSLLLAAILTGLASYHLWLLTDIDLVPSETVAFDLYPICFCALFIAQGLLLAAQRDGRVTADYVTYFDVGWSQAVQIGLGVLFAALLWGIAALGGGLFCLIGLGGLWEAVSSRWCILPLVATGFALSVNVTDHRVQLLRTSRSLFLTLAAWLSPALTLLTAAFLLALPATGLHLLWQTHRAGEYLVGAAFVHVLLINAIFGDGTPETTAARPLRWSASAASLLLTPLVAIAAYGALARIHQYGLTPSRIFLLADILVVGTYAAGYAAALLRSATWLGGLRPTNIAAAWLIVALILLLWSPALNPVRIAVNNQVARLKSGATPAAHFDFAFLQNAGPYGHAALRDLQATATGPDAEQIRAKALAASHTFGRAMPHIPPPPPPTEDEITAQIHVYPAGAHLPPSLLAQHWTNTDYSVPMCLRLKNNPCDVILLDIMDQGRPQALFLPHYRFQQGALLAQDTGEAPWRISATAAAPLGCDDVKAALRLGSLTVVKRAIPDISVAGHLVRFMPVKPDTCAP
jgi:hypothetical protein